MSELNKAKLFLILIVMVMFTFINVIHDNDWIGYLLSLLIFPLITWGAIELALKLKK